MGASSALGGAPAGPPDSLPLLEDGLHVRLCPLGIYRDGDRCVVMRLDTGERIRTSLIGAEAIGLFRKGCTIGGVKQALGRKHGYAPQDVDLLPLIRSLSLKAMIQRIGDHRLVGGSESILARALAYGRAYAMPKALALSVRLLPLPLLLRLLYRQRDSSQSEVLSSIQANLARVRSLGLSQEEIEAVSRNNCGLLIRSYIDRLLLMTLPPPKLAQWLRTYASTLGAEHLEHAIAKGNRIVLCGFHTGSFSLMPALLAQAGYRLTAYEDLPGRAGLAIERRVAQLRAAGLPYQLETARGPLGMRRLREAIEDGRMALIFPDRICPPHPKAVPVDLLGFKVVPGAGAGWLAHLDGVAVIPVHLTSGRDGRHVLTFHPALSASARGGDADDRSITAEVYRKLDEIVRANPAQWLRWKDLHLMVSGPDPRKGQT